MHRVTRPRCTQTSLTALAALLIAATVTSTAVFRAPAPGAPLLPVSGADDVVQILQGQQTILWTTLWGRVQSLVVQGWPTAADEAELGGGLYMERPEDGSAGVIAFGERPMSLHFQAEG